MKLKCRNFIKLHTFNSVLFCSVFLRKINTERAFLFIRGCTQRNAVDIGIGESQTDPLESHSVFFINKGFFSYLFHNLNLISFAVGIIYVLKHVLSAGKGSPVRFKVFAGFCGKSMWRR